MTTGQAIKRIEAGIIQLRDYSALQNPYSARETDETIVLLEEVIDALEHHRHPAQLSRQDRG